MMPPILPIHSTSFHCDHIRPDAARSRTEVIPSRLTCEGPMAQSLSSIPVDAPTDDLLALLNANGAAIVEGFLSPQTVAAFNGELDGLLAAEKGIVRQFPNDAIADFFGDKLNHVSGVAGKSKVLPSFISQRS